MLAQPSKKLGRLVLICLLLGLLSGCLEWLRAYQTYLQLNDFHHNFAIDASDDFTLLFKDPKLLSKDFVALSKLQPSEQKSLTVGKRWRYWFKKVNEQGVVLQPEINFFFDLKFNPLDRLTAWTFSPLFLKIAPAEFLEASLRSIAGAEINEGKKQLRAKTDLIDKIAAKLPLKSDVVAQLGEPLEIIAEDDVEVYRYHFMLQTPFIEKGYEDRALNAVRLTFDLTSHELVKMSGRFAGVKVSINYRNYLENELE
ncbi:MAG: hypothetical protein HOP02_01275 [Methylococcaceae bacterium]|nr:hypothetical protein [Methylococcaceae bacterium]